MTAVRSVISPALHEHRAVSGYKLENDLRAWYLHAWYEKHIDPDQRGYFTRRREARRWFRQLCDNPHFQNVLIALRREQEPLHRAISLVSWLKDVQRIVKEQSIPYKEAGRLSALDKFDTDGGLREPLLAELDNRLPDGIKKRPTTIAGLLDFLGVPSTGQEVATVLRRYARASVIPAKPEGAKEIARLLHSWGAPNREN